jgi:hypothetical protein
MNYILNSLEEIQKVYTPDIKYLNDDFIEHLYEFKLSKKVILESMRFRNKFSNSKGEEGFSSELSIEAIVTGMKYNLIFKSNLIHNFDYNYLLKNIDLEVFKTELDKKVSIQERDFVEKIKEELDNNNNPIKFVKKLREDKNSLVLSWKNLKSALEKANDFDKIIIDKYRVSYRRVYDSLKREHEKDIEPVVVFRLNDFWENDYKSNDESPWNSPFLGFGKNKTTNFETNIKTEITEAVSPFIDVSINEILSEPIKKLTECGFYKVFQTKYPEEEKQQSIIATIFRIHLKSTPIKYDIITTGTHYYNFCSKIGLISHLGKNEFKNGLEIARLLNNFSKSNDKDLKEIKIKTFQNYHTNRENPKSQYYPFSDGSNIKVNTILMKLNLIN